MIHLGDITAVNWHEVEPVDCVTGGSPCQDLSVAGKRAGLAGERSGLFMEQIRCVKELREADERRGRTGAMVRPRFMVWENVPGAFSSNGGKDFAAVLEETVKIIEPETPAVCVPERGWPGSGCLYDDMGRWSVAWRVHDAQFWGVPQRRRRIALVADFGGLAAPEVLFERKGLSGNFEQGGTQREEAAGATGGGTDSAIGFTNRGYYAGNVTEILGAGPHGAYPMVARSLTARYDGSPCADRGPNIVCAGFSFGQSEKARSIGYQEETSPTLRGGEGGNQKPCVFDARDHGNISETYQTFTGPLMANSHPGSYCGQDAYTDMLVAHTLKAKASCDFREDSETYVVQGLDCRNGRENGDVSGTLQAKPNGGFSYNCIHPVRINQSVRRLTPLECERLQGYPDGWTDIGDWTDTKGKKHKAADSPRYKALGNSIALPFWFWLLRRISAQYERPATLGSLFDGIGGFPLCWERCNGPKTARWASEIEEFPMALTRLRFGEEATNV